MSCDLVDLNRRRPTSTPPLKSLCGLLSTSIYEDQMRNPTTRRGSSENIHIFFIKTNFLYLF